MDTRRLNHGPTMLIVTVLLLVFLFVWLCRPDWPEQPKRQCLRQFERFRTCQASIIAAGKKTITRSFCRVVALKTSAASGRTGVTIVCLWATLTPLH